MALIDGLITYYKLDSNSIDSIGSNNGTDTSISYVAGKINDAAQFNGTSSQIAITKNISNYMSMEAWVYPTTNILQYTAIVSMQSADSADFGGMKIYSDTAGTLCIAFAPNSTTYIKSSDVAISNNVWSHIVGTYDGANLKLYVNGTLQSTVAYSGIIRNPTVNYSYIGNGKSWGGSLNYLYTGLIDEIGIWNRGITALEVSQLWNGGAGLAYPLNAQSVFIPKIIHI